MADWQAQHFSGIRVSPPPPLLLIGAGGAEKLVSKLPVPFCYLLCASCVPPASETRYFRQHPEQPRAGVGKTVNLVQQRKIALALCGTALTWHSRSCRRFVVFEIVRVDSVSTCVVRGMFWDLTEGDGMVKNQAR